MQPTQPHAKKRKKITIKPWLRVVLSVFVAAGVFSLGWAVGSGRISVSGFGPQQSLNKDLPSSLDYASVDEVYRALKNNYDGELKTDDLMDGLKTGLVKAAGNPYTEYLNPEAYKSFNEELNGSFTGIGAELSQDKDGNIVIVSPIAGFPAEKAGLKPKDVLIEIDGKSTAGMTVSEAVNKIRGPKDSQVKLKVVRGGKEQLEFTITRDTINIPSVKSEVKDGIGYLTISRFGDDTTQLAQQAAQDFKQQNVKGIVLDLRGDPGGLLNAAVSVSGMWLPKGTTVLTERRGGTVVNTLRSQNNPILQGIPTVVLINAGSASASEITAGALKDNGAATIVGDQSFGKGSVQQLINLKGGSVLKVTVARWYTPGGKNIDKEGITPDKQVKISDQDVKDGKDPQKDAALQILSQ